MQNANTKGRWTWTKNVTNNDKKSYGQYSLNNYSLEQSLGTFAKRSIIYKKRKRLVIYSHQNGNATESRRKWRTCPTAAV